MSDFLKQSDPEQLPNVVYDHKKRIEALEQALLDLNLGDDGETTTILTTETTIEADCNCCPDDVLGPGDPGLLPGGTFFPPGISPGPGDTGLCSGADLDIVNGPFALYWDQTDLNALESDRTAIAWFPAGVTVRPSSASAKTKIDFSLSAFVGLAADHFAVYALDSDGSTLLTATISGKVATFSPAVATVVYGFKVVLDDDSDTDFSLTSGSEVGTGGYISMDGSQKFPVTGSLTIGNIYKAHIIGGNLDYYCTPRDTWLVRDKSTETQFDLTNTGTWSGHLGTDDWELGPTVTQYDVGPTGALRAYRTTTDDPGNPKCGMDVWFIATDAHIGVKPWWASPSVGLNYRCYIFSASDIGERAMYLNSSLFNICGTV